jgi:chaperonin cofactor prefoldin
MNERQKRLIEVYEHLRKYFGIHTKTGFAEALHYGRTSMSAAMNGDEKYLTDSLFKNICEAYRGVFNLDYLLTGEGQLLTIEEEVTNEELEKMANPTTVPQAIDYTFLIEKAVEKATAYADKYIATLEKQVADKDKQIADLRSRVRELEMFINSQSFSKVIEKSPFPVGVADDGSVHILVDKG